MGEPIYVVFDRFPGGPDGPFVDTVYAEDLDARRRWSPSGGGWEVSDNGWWRLGPFVKAPEAAS